MKFSSFFLSAAMVAAICGLTACGSTSKVDVKYPTVQQMDALDVQWGLPPRKSRGTPSRSMTYDVAGEGASSQSQFGSAAAVSSPALPDPALEVPVSPPPQVPAPAPAPAMVIPDQLR
jgi:hypothetical protein